MDILERNNDQRRSNSEDTHRRCKWPVIIVFISFITLTGGGYWLLNTTPGLQWLLSTAARLSNDTLTIEGIDGTASALQIDSLNFQDETLQLAIHQLKFDWSPRKLLAGKLLINEINAQLIDIHTAPSAEDDEEQPALPEDLKPPIKISLEKLLINEIRIYSIDDTQSDEQPDFSLTDLSIQLESNSQHHQLAHLTFNSRLGAFKASGQIQAIHPFNLDSIIYLDGPAKWGAGQATLTGTLEQLEIRLEHHNIPMYGTLHMQLQPFAQTPITALNAAITEFNPAMLFTEAPQASFSLHTALNRNKDNQLTGRLMLKNEAAAPLDRNGLPLEAISMQILLADETLTLDDLQIGLSEKGFISGNMVWRLDQASGLAELNVGNLNPAAIDTRLQAAKISGLVQLSGDADTQHIDINLNDQALKLDAAATRTASRILLERIDLSHGQSSLTGSAELSLGDEDTANDTQPFHFKGQLKRFNIADFIKAPESNLNTKLTVSGNLSPRFSGTLDYQFEKSHLNRQPVNGKGQIRFEQPFSIASRADFQVGSNQVGIHGKFGKPDNSLVLNITAPSLAQIGLGFSGYLKTRIDLTGTLDSPFIDFDIDSEKLALPGNQVLDYLTAKGRLHEEALELMLTANQYRSDEETRVKQLNLNVSGKRSKHRIRTDLRIDDQMSVTLQADGGLFEYGKADTSPGWQGVLSHLSVTGQVPVHLQAPVAIKLSSEQITVRNAQFGVAGGQATIEKVFWSPQRWETSGDFSGIGLHPDSDLIPKENILQLGGKWNLHALASFAKLNGEIEIAREKGDWYLPGELPQAIGLQTLKLFARARDGRLTGQFDLTSTHIGETRARIAFPLAYPGTDALISPQTPLNGHINLTVSDLSWLDHLIDSPIQTGGRIELQADIAGTVDKPALQGSIQGKDLAVALLDHGLNLHQGVLLAGFDQSALHIDQFSFISPNESPPKDRLLKKLKLEDKPGTLEITGSLGFKDNAHHLAVALDHLYLVHPPHYWIVASGKSTARLLDNVLDLDGEIIANAGLITQPPATRPQLADDIIITDSTTQAEPKTNLENEQQALIVNLHASLDLGKQFFLRVAGLEGRLDGNLRIQNDENKALSVVGSIATRQTTFKAYGQDLTVERGIVNFNGPIDDPGLNVLALRKGLAVEAGIEVAGSVRHPKIKLVSTPHVPDTEKLSWIVLGRAPDVSGLDTSLLLSAAGSILGGQSGNGITGQLSEMLGVDEISFRQGTSGSPLTSQIGTVGKRLSSRAYLSYERGITATTAGITKLTYSLTPKITVVTQAGEDSAIDLFYTFRFD